MRLPRAKILVMTILVVLLTLVTAFIFNNDPPKSSQNSPSQTQTSQQKPAPKPTAKPAPAKAEYDDPNSLKVVVNKKRPLPNNYVPNDLQGNLRREAAVASNQMTAAAANSGVSIKLISGYRSQSNQASLYNSYVKKDGQAAADTYSARPRHSEHQTGLAADYGNSNGECALEICFANTAGGQWLAANAHNYGFIIRYENGKTHITGYQYEPWHLRYVGVDLAKQIKSSGKTMEEFFGLPAAPNY